MNYEYILAIDPSGSFYEGKGTTGWCVVNCKENNKITTGGDIRAIKFESPAFYINAHVQLIQKFQAKYKSMIVVIEDYILYAGKAQDQINSHMETSKLIGALQYYCDMNGIPYTMQLASEVKNRWSDVILHHKGYIGLKGRYYILPHNPDISLHKHIRDAIRHGIHYATFKNKKVIKHEQSRQTKIKQSYCTR